jgi:hypothetical protein
VTQKFEKNDPDCAGQKQKDTLTFVTQESRILEILLKYQVVRKKSKGGALYLIFLSQSQS